VINVEPCHGPEDTYCPSCGIGAPPARWRRVGKFEPAAALLADRHYSRRKIGSPQFMPPGQTLILYGADDGFGGSAVFGWWRPHPDSGLRAMNNLDGWTCSIFHNESVYLSSELILEAEKMLAETYDCGPSGMLTYVFGAKVESPNKGFCFKMAGWVPVGTSADKKKILLWKPFHLAGIQASAVRQ
jgi:hypothetical protein